MKAYNLMKRLNNKDELKSIAVNLIGISFKIRQMKIAINDPRTTRTVKESKIKKMKDFMRSKQKYEEKFR